MLPRASQFGDYISVSQSGWLFLELLGSVSQGQSREVLRTHLANRRYCTFGDGRMSQIGGESQAGRLEG